MDQQGLRTLTRTLTELPSRRDVLHGLAATGIALGTVRLPRLAVASKRATGEPAAQANNDSCRKTRASCRRDEQCCSGSCKRNRKNGEQRCRRTVGARGCTIEDGCNQVPCPDDPNGKCTVTVGGKPFCFKDSACFACDSDQDCVDEYGVPGLRCVECPEVCDATTNFRACAIYDTEAA